MKIERLNAQSPTPQDLQDLEHLKAHIEQAIADGIVTPEEVRNLRETIARQGHASAELLYRELELYRTLVTEKARSGDLELPTPGLG